MKGEEEEERAARPSTGENIAATVAQHADFPGAAARAFMAQPRGVGVFNLTMFIYCYNTPPTRFAWTWLSCKYTDYKAVNADERIGRARERGIGMRARCQQQRARRPTDR